MRLVNLTPHPLVLVASDGERVAIRPHVGPDGKPAPARVLPGAEDTVTVAGLPCPVIYPHAGDGELVGLPEPVEGVRYLVSLIVLSHPGVRLRHDVFAPATGPTDGAIRDGNGQLIAVTKLRAPTR